MTEPKTAAEIARAVAAGERSPVEVAQAALADVKRWEARLDAWITIDEEGALAAARDLERRIARGIDPGPLAGVPVGLKDIFDAEGLPTTNGVDKTAKPARRDSNAARRLRDAGAIILGKTVTTAYAYVDPSPTRNPRHADRTPGGSSSGSGAAVAAGTAPLALGSQTAGSTLRPASYNGAVGFKPSFGRIGRSGVTPLAPSLDHVGIICRSVEDAAIGLDVLAGSDPGDPASVAGSPGAVRGLGLAEQGGAPRLGVVLEAFELSDEATANEIRRVITGLQRAGAVIADVRMPLRQMIACQRITMWSESAAIHRDLTWRRDDLPIPRLRQVTRMGALVPASAYLRADRLRRRYRHLAENLLLAFDALVMPTVSTTAPGRETTGDPALQSPWTLTGLPSISLPTSLDADGLPYGLQLVGSYGGDARLLRIAKWVEARLEPLPPPKQP